MNVNERFDKFVVPDGDCLRWVGGHLTKGYGLFGVTVAFKTRVMVCAHRYAYERYKGNIPAGMIVRHSCNNTWCVNPEHLQLGTAQDNSDDMVRAKRQCKGESKSLSKLTETQVLEARASFAAGVRCCELERSYGVSHRTMWDAIHRRSWKHI